MCLPDFVGFWQALNQKQRKKGTGEVESEFAFTPDSEGFGCPEDPLTWG